MNPEAPATSACLPGLDEPAFAPLASEPGRRAAFDAYRALPGPARTDEEWRRTDPAAFDAAGLRRAALRRADPPPAAGADPVREGFDAVVTVAGDAWDVEDRGAGLAIEPLDGAGESDPAGALRPAVDPRAAGPDKFERANAAFWNFGLRIRAGRGAAPGRGVLVDVRVPGGALLLPRVLLVADEGARLAVAVRVRSAVGGDAGAAAVNAALAARVGPGARLTVAVVQELGESATWIGSEGAVVAEGGAVDWLSAHFGARAVKSRVFAEAAGAGAELRLGALSFASGGQHFDHKTLQVHSHSDTRSDLLYRTIAQDRASTVFQGVIVARPGAVRIDAYQRNNNLVLGREARADSLPGLRIDADDLRCTHGSTIGNLDPEQLFYLRSRGFGEPAARRMLIEAFGEAIVGRIPQPPLREAVRTAVARKVGAEEGDPR
jgi:Fe-S cluster assembly protein SufD